VIERTETRREERTVTIKLGAFELVARERGRTWSGAVYRADLLSASPAALAFCPSAADADAVFGHLVAELGELMHAIGVAIEAAQNHCQDCDRQLPLGTPSLCGRCVAARNDCEGCGATCNPRDTSCYACGAALRGAA
jgi:hypothetical protein